MMSPRYAHGKQSEIKSFKEIKNLVSKAKLSNEEEAFFWLLYYCGVRKSEAYERIAEDCKVTAEHFVVDFHQRKKNGAIVPPLKLRRDWLGVDKLIKQLELARTHKARFKNIFLSVETGETRITPTGKKTKVKKRTKELRKGKWLFPHVQSSRAWEIVKEVLGEKFYPHFLRLNRLSEIGSDPSASLLRLKSFSGIKSARVLDSYLGTSEKEQDKALAFMDKKMT